MSRQRPGEAVASEGARTATGRPYGIARVLRVWDLPRSDLLCPTGPSGRASDGAARPDAPLDDARRSPRSAGITESPFHGEGHRKIWARLRALKGVRTSMCRVLRDGARLAPARQPEPVARTPARRDHPHQSAQRHGCTDAPAAVTSLEGQVTIFAAIDHCNAACVGIRAARHGDRFEVLEPVRPGVRYHFGVYGPATEHGLALRHDHGSVYLSGEFQTEITLAV